MKLIRPTILWKYFFSITLAVILSLLGLYLYLIPELEGLLLQGLEKDLSEKTQLLANYLLSKNLGELDREDIDELADEIGNRIHTRITIITNDGTVLGDTELDGHDLFAIDNHSNRLEVVGAQNSRYGSSRRYSQTLAQEMVYVARRTEWGYLRLAIPVTDVEKVLYQVKRAVLLSAFLALILAALIGYPLSRSMAEPIKRLLEVTNEISKGNFTVRFSERAGDELSRLGQSINMMAMDLEKQIAKWVTEQERLHTILQSMEEGVLVTDEKSKIEIMNMVLQQMLHVVGDYKGKSVIEHLRHPAIHQLIDTVFKEGRSLAREIMVQMDQEARYFLIHSAVLKKGGDAYGTVSVFHDLTAMKRLENVRKDFVANVSHELKTPLTNIRGFTETLQSGALRDVDVASRFLQKIESNAMQLQNLVEDILKLSKIESGHFELNLVEVKPFDIVKNIQGDFLELITASQLNFEVHAESRLRIIADPNYLEQVLRNLIDNAIKYTPSGGRILVEVSATSLGTRFSVSDSGIGIPKDEVSRIFERFYRVDKARSRSVGGTGLGLAIVKHLVQAHGGEISVKSALNQGTTFSFVLPVKIVT